MVEIAFSFCKFIYKFNIINKMEHKKILQKELIDRLKKICTPVVCFCLQKRVQGKTLFYICTALADRTI